MARAGGAVPEMILATLCYVKQAGKTLMLHRNKKPGDIHAGKWNGLHANHLSNASLLQIDN
jgi:hypothetical protein